MRSKLPQGEVQFAAKSSIVGKNHKEAVSDFGSIDAVPDLIRGSQVKAPH